MREKLNFKVKFNIKKVLWGLLVAGLLTGSVFSCVHSSYAEEQVKENDKSYKVGFYYLPGVNEINPNGKLDGYNYELLERMNLYCSCKYKFEGYDVSMEKQLEAMAKGELDMVPGIAKTPERMERFAFTDKSIGFAATTVTALEDCPNTELKKGMHITVGLLKSSYCNDIFAAEAKYVGATFTPVYFDTFKQMEEALLAKKIDVLVSNNMDPVKGSKIIDVLGYREHYIAVSKQNPALKRHLDSIIESMDNSNPFWRRDIYAHHNQNLNGSSMLHLDDKEKAYLEQLRQEGRVLKVLTNPKRYPLSEWNGTKYEGIMVDVLAEVAKRLNIKYEFIPVKNSKEYAKIWQSNKADIVLGCYDDYQMPYDNYRLTSPYLQMDLAYIYRKETKGNIKRFAMLKPYSANMKDVFSKAMPADAKPIIYPDSNSCLEAVLSGDVDAAIVLSSVAQEELAKDHRNRLGMQIIPDSRTGIAMGISKKEDHHLASALQKAITNVKGNFIYQYMADRASLRKTESTYVDLIYNNPLQSMVILGVFLLAAFGCYYSYRRSKVLELIESKNALLQEKNDMLLEFQKAMNSGMWKADYDENGKIKNVYFSDEFREIFHLKDVERFPNVKDVWLSRMHPDDRKGAYQELLRYLNNEIGPDEYSTPYRILNGKDEYRWTKVKGMTQFWPNGKIKSFTGFTIDVTDDYNTDFLTGEFTGSGFNTAVEHFLSQHEDRTPFSIAYFNIRDFKAINELWGFDTGDALLKNFCVKLLNSELKPRFLGRKGDHFVLLVENNQDMLSQVSKLCTFAFSYPGGSFAVRSRCGIYHLENNGLNVASMVDRARLAEGSVANEYVQHYAIYNEGIKEKYVAEAFAISELDRAIDNKEFEVYYQPIVECATGKIASAESLVRWNHPQKGLLYPDTFIPAFENNGCIAKLDRYVFQTVMDMYESRIKAGKPIVPISSNCSWMDFYNEDIIEWALKTLEKSTLDPNLLRIELTESSYSALNSSVQEVMESLKKYNITWIIDDFGKGVSSMEMLQRYNFKILKLDMFLTQQIGKNTRTANMLKAIIDTCHQLGMKVIAEGVETKDQLDFYLENSCDYIQGHLFYKAMPQEAFVKLLEEKQDKGRLVDFTVKEKYLPSTYYKGHIYFPSEKMQRASNMAMETVLSLIGENSGVGAVSGCYDDNLTICYFSNLAAEMLGYNQWELLEVSKGSYLNLIAPEDRDSYLSDKDMVRYYRLVGKNGRLIQVKEIRTDVEGRNGETQWVVSIRKLDDVTEDEIARILDLREAVERDSFTGLLTKNAFFDKIHRVLSADPEAPCSLLIFDLDMLKSINDVCGHLRGDEVILTVTKVLKNSFRDGDIIGRFGGDEFMVFLRNSNDPEVVRHRVETVQQELANRQYLYKLNRPATLSVGAACSTGRPLTSGQLFEKADKALYEAKNSGRNALRIV